MARPRATSYAKPISAERLVKVRKRAYHLCPFCDHEASLQHAIKARSMGWFMLDCPSCTRSFCLPYPRSFDPTVPAPVKLDYYRWADCPFCKVRFQFKNKYEQCPCCGKVLFEAGSRFEFKLNDNKEEVLDVIAQFKKQNRSWWHL